MCVGVSRFLELLLGKKTSVTGLARSVGGCQRVFSFIVLFVRPAVYGGPNNSCPNIVRH